MTVMKLKGTSPENLQDAADFFERVSRHRGRTIAAKES